MDADTADGVSRRNLLAALGACGALQVSVPTHAACEPIRMPVSPAGALAQWREGRFTGLLPDLQAALEKRLGCQVSVPFVPRARQAKMFFETHEADVLWPAIRHPNRDKVARFSPFVRGAVQLVTLTGLDERPQDLAALISRSDWRGALVRGYSFGLAFDDLAQTLERERRVTQVRDVSTALRMLSAGRVQFTLLTVLTVYGETLEAGVEPFRRFDLRALAGLPNYEAGAYVSRQSLPLDAQDRLLSALNALVDDGDMLRLLRRHYPAHILARVL